MPDMDEADKVAHQALIERYLKRFNGFVEDHSFDLIQILEDFHFPFNSDLTKNPPKKNLNQLSEEINAKGDDKTISANSKWRKDRKNKTNRDLSGSSLLCAFGLTHNIWDYASDPIEMTWGSPLLTDTLTYEQLITSAFAGHSDSSSDLNANPSPDVEKVMLVLCSITSQMRDWKDEGWTKFVDQLVLYGDGFEDERGPNTSVTEGKGHLTIANFLPVLYDLEEFTHNCILLISNCVQQLSALFKDSKPHVVSILGLHLPTVFSELANLLVVLVVLDEILANQSILQEHWTKYRRMIKSVRADSMTFGVDDPENLVKLEKDLIALDKNIMSAHLFKTVVERVTLGLGLGVGQRRQAKSMTSNANLAEKFVYVLTSWSTNLEKDWLEGVNELKPIALASLFIFALHLLPNTKELDGRKLFQRVVWEGLKRIPAVPIRGSLLWVPETFLNSFPIMSSLKMLDGKTLQSLVGARHSFLQQKVASLGKDVLNYHLQISSWTLRLQETFYSKDMSQLRLEDLSRRSNLLTQGVKLAQLLSQNFRVLINLHANLGRPVTKQTVSLLCQLVELLKMIQSTFHRFNVQVCESAASIVQNVMHIALSNVSSLKMHFESLKDPRRVDETRSDTLAVLAILENVLGLKGGPSKRRMLVARLSYEWVLASYRLWREEDNTGILAVALERIEQMLEVQDKIKEACHGGWIYWHRVILSAYFSSVYLGAGNLGGNNNNGGGGGLEGEVRKLNFMFLALNDCIDMIQAKSPHGEEAKKNFIKEVEDCFRVNFVEKLCGDIETDLRLWSHTHLNVNVGGSYNSITADSGLGSGGGGSNGSGGLNGGGDGFSFQGVGIGSTCKDYKSLLEGPSIYFNGSRINLKFIVENYLSKTFYNLASVALHDWQSYATMRVLGADKYSLEIMEDHLPGHTLEQGLDILEIVRNLNKFVTEFSYNLNNQVFVQMNSPNKHLDTVNIRHLANSLRTHGPGMTNTTVNSTYQFLRAKIHTFSQFLYDEQINSRLSKEIRLFKQTSEGRRGGGGGDGSGNDPGGFPFSHAGQQMDGRSSSEAGGATVGQTESFPYDRVLKFQRGIRKLGLSPEGLSPLDQFRVLITHIGNALGFVRLVRSGGLHFLATGCRFVPDLEDTPDFSNLSKEAHQLDEGGSIDGKDPTESSAQSKSKIFEEVKAASSNLDSTFKHLSSSVTDSVDYLGLLANGFAGPCRDPRNGHLKNFHVIIPALTLSYVDHMRSCKEKLLKKAQSPALFTDDGFPMGVAYLLKVLGQDQEFDSLQWFSGVTKRLTRERDRALQAIQESKTDEKLQQANTLTAKRLQDSLHEFHLLRYNISSARIFFQQSQIQSQNQNKAGSQSQNETENQNQAKQSSEESTR